MGNKQSYDLTQAQARSNESRLPEEVVTPKDEVCRPVSIASTSSMRKPTKQRTKRAKDHDKENDSLGSSRADTASPNDDHVEVHESAIDVPEEPIHPPGDIQQQKSREENILSQPFSPQSNSHYDQVPVEEEILIRAHELPKTELSGENITTVEVLPEKPETEKERAKMVAEEAVKQFEAKRNSKDHGHQHTASHHSHNEQPHPSNDVTKEKLHKVPEVEHIPLDQGGTQKDEEAEIEEVTRQLDDAIRVTEDDNMTHEDSAVVLEESTVEEFATVSLALDEDISAIEISRVSREFQKLYYTQPLEASPLDAAPSQTGYTKLK